MKLSAMVIAPTIALWGALFITACTEEAPPSLLGPERSSELLAHSPVQHGVHAAPSITSVPDYAGLEGATAQGRGKSLHLTVDAAGSIPRFPDSYITSVAVFGYAWADLDTGAGIVAVIHPVIGRDSRQNPDGWHTHPVQLSGGTKPSGTSDFCIESIGRSQGGIAILGDIMRVHMAERWAGISASALDVAASFVVQGDSGCAGSGLGVVVLDAEAL